MNSASIHIDLIVEIFTRLPVKSIARFRFLSKQRASILDRPYFKELFLTRSSTRPRILLAMPKNGVWSFFSFPQRHNPNEKSSFLVVAPEFHVKFPPDNMRIYPSDDRSCRRYFACSYASGLIYFYRLDNREMDCDEAREVPVICNPNTGRYAALPYLERYGKSHSYLGFDPIDKQFKVLFMGYPFSRDSNRHRILTLRTGEMMWRKIKCSLGHEKVSEGVCINGVLYYLGYTPRVIGNDGLSDYVIVCFDVRSEKFKFIDVESFCKLINYKGKLAVVYWKDYHPKVDNFHWDQNDCVEWEDYVKDSSIGELRVWVLENAEKQEWSKYVYTLRDEDKFSSCYVSVVGGTARGEIVFTMCYYTCRQPFYVFFYNPERNNFRSVEIQGFGEYYNEALNNHSVYTFVDHVEDLNVNDPKLLTSVFNAQYVKIEEEESDSE